MRLLFLVENTNPDGKLVFGNWDMHETLPRSRWYFYNGENPSSGGISLKYVSAIEIRQPQLISCDASGLVKDAFKPGEEVYVKGTGLTSNASYRLWIQPEPVTLAAYNSLDVPTLNSYRFNTASDPSGSQELVTTNADGNFNAVVVWNTSPGNSLSAKYDIIADNQSAGTAGQMDSADYIDNPGFEGFRIEVTDTVKAPAAAFAASPTSGVPPLTVNFTDLSSNSPTSWSWDFDNDGNSDSDVQNPSFTYNELGNYTVKLTVSNPAGSDNEIKINYISVHALDDYPDWDVNRDGEINIIDISSIARHLQETGAPGWIRADVNKDGIIDQDDIDIVVSHMRTSEIPAAPGITSFSPASAGQGSSVVITGTYFTGATAVSFGGMPAQSFTVNNSTQITARVAGGASGPVSVITLYGTAAKSGFTFIAAPSITSFSPASGSTDTTVRIYGTNFTGATRVSFGGTSASFFTVNSATQITATVGDGSSGQINVVTPGGTANSSSSFSYVAPGNPPTISSFYPSSAASGTLVTITGARLGNALSVSFGGVEAASISSNSNSTIVAEVAYGASGDVSVTTADGTASRAGFNYIQAPGISSFTPSQGKQGTAVTIYGSNFVGVTSVTFGGVSADFTIISSTRISAVVGNGASGAIRVTTAAGTTISYTNFTYIPPAALFSVNLSLPEKTVSPGDNFDIAVQINTGTNPVRGAGFALAYDKSKMQCLSVSEGDFFKAWAQLHNCSTMMFPSPAIDNYLGKASFSISIMGQTNGGPSGIGMVCVFHLTALSGITGQSILTFANTLVSDQYGNVLPNAAFQNGIVTFSNNLSTPSSSPFLTAAPSYNPPTPLPSGTVSEMVPGDKPSVAPTGMSPPSSSVPGQTAASSGTPSTAPENSQSGLPDAVFDLAGQINSQGIFINDFQDQQTINSNDIIARLDIVRGTAVSHPQGKPIEKIIISRTNTPPDLVAGGNIVIAAFQVAPDGCAFSQPISLTIKYYPGDIAVGFVEKDLVLTYKDPVSGKWMDAPSLVDPENHVITTQIDQLSPIAIVLRPTPALRWSIFAIIVAAEIVIGLIIVFYLLRRKRARA
jgi:PKD repeat protein